MHTVQHGILPVLVIVCGKQDIIGLVALAGGRVVSAALDGAVLYSRLLLMGAVGLSVDHLFLHQLRVLCHGVADRGSLGNDLLNGELAYLAENILLNEDKICNITGAALVDIKGLFQPCVVKLAGEESLSCGCHVEAVNDLIAVDIAKDNRNCLGTVNDCACGSADGFIHAEIVLVLSRFNVELEV